MHQPVIARQHHGAAVEHRQKIHIDVGLRFAGRLIGNAALDKLLSRKLSAKSVAKNPVDTIALQHIAKLGNGRLRRKWRHLFVNQVDEDSITLTMADCQTEAINRTGAWID